MKLVASTHPGVGQGKAHVGWPGVPSCQSSRSNTAVVYSYQTESKNNNSGTTVSEPQASPASTDVPLQIGQNATATSRPDAPSVQESNVLNSIKGSGWSLGSLVPKWWKEQSTEYVDETVTEVEEQANPPELLTALDGTSLPDILLSEDNVATKGPITKKQNTDGVSYQQAVHMQHPLVQQDIEAYSNRQLVGASESHIAPLSSSKSVVGSLI